MGPTEKRYFGTTWNQQTEMIYTYLWFLGESDGHILSKFTGETSKKCTNKKSQYPHIGKYEDITLLSAITHPKAPVTSVATLHKIAVGLFRKRSKKSFDEIVKKLSSYGVKSPTQIYNYWHRTYKVSQELLPSDATDAFLQEAESSKKKKYYSWISSEKMLYSRFGVDMVPWRLSVIHRSLKKEKEEVYQAAKELLQITGSYV